MGVYVNGDIEQKLQKVGRWMEEKEQRVRTIVGGDFNARTGVEGRGVGEGEGMRREGQGRKSKDKKLDREGRILIKFIEERGWGIFNGVVWGDEEGEYGN